MKVAIRLTGSASMISSASCYLDFRASRGDGKVCQDIWELKCPAEGHAFQCLPEPARTGSRHLEGFCQ